MLERGRLAPLRYLTCRLALARLQTNKRTCLGKKHTNHKSVTNVVSAPTARAQLGQIIKRATENHERFVIDRHGEPSVIIMSLSDYIHAIAPAPKELRALQTQARRKGLEKLSMRQIDSIVGAVRRSVSKAIKHRAS